MGNMAYGEPIKGEVIDSVYPPSPDPKSGFIKPDLNECTNLTKPGKENVGSIVFVNFKDKDNAERSSTGRVVQSDIAILTIQNEDTGEITKIDTNTDRVEEIWLKPSTVKWEEITEFNGDIFRKLETSKDTPFVILNGHVIESKKDIILAGRASVVEVSPGYKVVQIVDSKGKTNLVDPSLLYFNLLIDVENNPEAANFKLGSEKSGLTEIDKLHEQRLKLAKDLFKDVTEDGLGILENQKLYDFLVSNPRETQLLIQRYYGQEANTLIKEISDTIGEIYTCLLVDPGIVSHMDTFKAYVKDLDKIPDSPLGLRASFSVHLGSRTVYRGMALTTSEEQNISNNGLLTPGLRDQTTAEKILFNTFDHHERNTISAIGSSFKDEIGNRLRDIYSNSKYFMAMSVSTIREIAESVGFHSSGRASEKDVVPFLLTLNVPELSIIEPVGVFKPERQPDRAVKIGEKIFGSEYKSVEMFIPYSVKPGCIQSEKIDIPPAWQWVENKP